MVADSHSRPADILLSIWCFGRPAALDIHVISPLQELTLYAAASTPGHTVKVGVQRMEAMGGLSEDTISTVQAIRKAIFKRASPDDLSSSPGLLSTV